MTVSPCILHATMGNIPLVSCLVLNYRMPRDAVRCVQALRQQTIANQLEIIVADNHSDDDSIGILRNRLGEQMGVRIVEIPANLGYSRGNNRGAAYAKGKYLLITNPDNELEPGALEHMVRTLEQDASIGIIALKLVHPDGTRRDSFRRFPSAMDIILKRLPLRKLAHKRLERYLRRQEEPTDPIDADWVVGTCILISAELFRSLGGFDERFFLFFDDIDLCRRCWITGKRVVFDPRISARERQERLSEGGMFSLLMSRVGRTHIASAIKYFWKWRGQPLPAKTLCFR